MFHWITYHVAYTVFVGIDCRIKMLNWSGGCQNSPFHATVFDNRRQEWPLLCSWKMWFTPELKMSVQLESNPMKKPCAGLDKPMLQIGKKTETTTATKNSYFGPCCKMRQWALLPPLMVSSQGRLVGVSLSLFPSHHSSHQLWPPCIALLGFYTGKSSASTFVRFPRQGAGCLM